MARPAKPMIRRAAARFLQDSEVPVGLHIRILDGMEALLMGTVLSESINTFLLVGVGFRTLDAASEPELSAAASGCRMSSHELFEAKVRAFLTGGDRMQMRPTMSAKRGNAALHHGC